MSTQTIAGKTVIQGPGLKKQGIVVLQFFFISFFGAIEFAFRSGTGFITGVIICAVLYGGLRFGRPGTTYVAVVTPPLAFAAFLILWTLLTDGLSPAKIGVDFLASLASEAPFLLLSALYGWFVYFNEKAKARPSKRRD